MPWGVAGKAYTITAVVLGGPFLFLAFAGLSKRAGDGWARRVFAYSLVYLPALIAVLVLDAS